MIKGRIFKYTSSERELLTEAMDELNTLDPYRQKQRMKKVNRLITYWGKPPSNRKQRLHKDEFYMNLEDIEKYLEKAMAESADSDWTERVRASKYFLDLVKYKEGKKVSKVEIAFNMEAFKRNAE